MPGNQHSACKPGDSTCHTLLCRLPAKILPDHVPKHYCLAWGSCSQLHGQLPALPWAPSVPLPHNSTHPSPLSSTTACRLLLPRTNQLAQLPLDAVPSQSISLHPCSTTPHALVRHAFILQANVGKTSACHSLFPSLHAVLGWSLWRNTWLHSSGCCWLSLVLLAT